MYESIIYEGAGRFVSEGEWIHPDRIANSYELIFVILGTVYICENGTQYELKKNHILLLEPGYRHYGFKKSASTSFFWLHFTGEPQSNLLPKHQCINEGYNLSILFKQILHYLTENQSNECLNYLTRLILFEVFSRKEEKDKNRITSELAAWITANRDIHIKVEDLAKHFGYNPDYISRIFKLSYGKSVKEYIDSIRMDHIKKLLLTGDMTLTQIASSTGFTEYKYFLKFFKYHEGITPTQFLASYPKTHINIK